MNNNEAILDDGPLRAQPRKNPTYVIKGTCAATPPPAESWWIGKSREELSAAVAARDQEMRSSHTWRSLERITKPGSL